MSFDENFANGKLFYHKDCTIYIHVNEYFQEKGTFRSVVAENGVDYYDGPPALYGDDLDKLFRASRDLIDGWKSRRAEEIQKVKPLQDKLDKWSEEVRTAK